MSKTLKTRPIDIRMFDKRDNGLVLVERHNHKDGRECDLPERNIKANIEHVTNLEHPSESCRWDWQYNGHGVCGCAMCTGKFSRKWENRKDRHATKTEIHKALLDGDEEKLETL